MKIMTTTNYSPNKKTTPDVEEVIDQNTIAYRVRWKRKKLGLLSKELAAACDVPPSSINMLEMNRVGQPRYLKKLAEVLQVTTDFLLYGEDDLPEIEGNATLISVAAPLQPNFDSSDYYVVKMEKGTKPFYAEGMKQVGQVNEVFIGHKKKNNPI